MLQVNDATLKRLRELDECYVQATPEARKGLVWESIRQLAQLAPWWLEPSALSQFVRERPHYRSVLGWLQDGALPSETNDALALVTCTFRPLTFEVGSRPLADRLLRPAQVLPLCWYPREEDGNLPDSLLELATKVRRLFRAEGYGLDWWFPNRKCIDARELSLTADSAFFALAAGLKMALVKQHSPAVRARPTVWVTGAWDFEANEVEEVGGIEAKVSTMLQFQAEHVFVPPQNYHQARAVVRQQGKDPNCVKMLPLVNDPEQALRPILAELRLPPAPSDPFVERKDYWVHLGRYAPVSKTNQYYRENLLNDVAELCRRKLPPSLDHLARKETLLVTSLSHRPEMVLIAHRVFRPSRVVLLVKSLQHKPWTEFQPLLDQWREKHHLQYEPREFAAESPDDAFALARQLYDDLKDSASGRPIVVDLTPGPKLATLGLFAHCSPGVHLVYLQHRYHPEIRQPEPGSEHYVSLQPLGAGPMAES